MTAPSAAQPKTQVCIDKESCINVVHLAGRQSHGPTILFLHANGFHINCTAPLARCFDEHGLCIGIEFRGQGLLPAPDSAEHLVEAYTRDVLAVIRALQLKGCYCFGHSGGGQVALAAEAQHPGTFAAIYAYEPVLSNVAPSDTAQHKSGGIAYERLRDAALRRKAKFGSKAEVERRFRSRPPFANFHAAAWKEYLDNNFTESADGACTLTCQPKDEARWFFDAGSYSINNMYHHVPKVQCPVRLAVGQPQGSFNYLVENCVSQVHRFPDAKLVRFEQLGHLGPMEDPAAVASDMLAFFQSCQATSGSTRARL